MDKLKNNKIFLVIVLLVIVSFLGFLSNSYLAKKESNSVSFDRSFIRSNIKSSIPIKVYVEAPEGKMAYTVSVMVEFPAQKIKIESWEYASDWISLPKEEYDVINNQAGFMIKTAGYPNGFTGKKLLGIATVSSTGYTGEIVVGGKTFMLDENGNNIYRGGDKIIVRSAYSSPLVNKKFNLFK